MFNKFILLVYNYFNTFFATSSNEDNINEFSENLTDCSICYGTIHPQTAKLFKKLKSDATIFDTYQNDEYSNYGLNISIFSCVHANQFHPECLWEWIVKNIDLNIESITSCYCSSLYYKSDCPICRQPIITHIGYDSF
jgi:hypothetical protein